MLISQNEKDERWGYNAAVLMLAVFVVNLAFVLAETGRGELLPAHFGYLGLLLIVPAAMLDRVPYVLTFCITAGVSSVVHGLFQTAVTSAPGNEMYVTFYGFAVCSVSLILVVLFFTLTRRRVKKLAKEAEAEVRRRAWVIEFTSEIPPAYNPEPVVVPTSKVCSSCGVSNSLDQNYCDGCGAAL